MTTLAEAVYMAGLPLPAARAFMRECNMTLDDRERHAYIEGSTEKAILLGLAIDTENAAIDEMRHERDMAQEEANDFAKDNDGLQDALEVSESKVLTLTSDLENAQDEIKALQTQISAAGVDLV